MRLIDGNKIIMSLADWWYSSFGQEETEESKAIKKVMDQVEKMVMEMPEEIVRCKECRNRHRQHRCAGRHPNWFCGDGVKDEITIQTGQTYGKSANVASEVVDFNNMISAGGRIRNLPPVEDMGEVSDGYHTFNQLYHQRAVLFATIVKQNKDKAWKSWKHEDGKFCFDKEKEWFIVGVDTPEGSYTYHYEQKYWELFDCEELDRGNHWDGHTEEDVTRLLSLPPVEPEPVCEDAISRADTIKAMCLECWGKGACGADYCTDIEVVRGMPPVEPKPATDDCISRQAAIECCSCLHPEDCWAEIKALPSAEPERPKGEWIPVSERLPKEEEKTYWVCTDTEYQCECRWTNNRFGIGVAEWGWSIFDTPQYTKPIAWMPLPEPYRVSEYER